MVLILVLVYYVLESAPDTVSNPIDRGILRKLWSRAGSYPSEEWRKALKRAVLMFSDQQLVTGIALLASGYSQLKCGISSYHWQILVYLAWFSSITHLTTLTLLQDYFHYNPSIRNWRVFFMLVVFVMLGASLLPTGNAVWLDSQSSGLPAICYFYALSRRGRYYVPQLEASKVYHSPDMSTIWPNSSFYKLKFSPTTSMTISIVYLCLGYLTRTVKLSRTGPNLARLWLRTKPGNVIKRLLDILDRQYSMVGLLTHLVALLGYNAVLVWMLGLPTRVIAKLGYEAVLVVYVLLKAVFDLLESMMWDVGVYFPLLRSVKLDQIKIL